MEFMETHSRDRSGDEQKIFFSNGNQARTISTPPGTPAGEIVSLLGIQVPQNVILIVGGALAMKQEINEKLLPLLLHGVVRPATSLGALIIDGGTHTGVMALLGRGVEQLQKKPLLLGIVPGDTVAYPGQGKSSQQTPPLDPNHSHFVLVETDTWGEETSTMYELAQFLTRDRTSVALLINGGEIAMREVVYNVRQGRPLIVIEGSGRLADTIARGMRDAKFSASDPDLTEILADGDLHLFPITGSAQALEQLTLRLLKRN